MPIQDLIQHARHLARRRAGTGCSLVHLGASPYIKGNAARYHFFRNSIGELARARGAQLFELDAHRFAVVAENRLAHAELTRLLESEAGCSGAALARICEHFVLPAQYLELRERLAALAAGDDEAAATAPSPDAPAGVAAEPLCGPLTPALLARIEDRLDGVDLEPFVRRRPVHAWAAGWQRVYIEQDADLDALAAAYFPAVERIPGEPLEGELRRHLDRLMLLAVLLNRPWRRQPIGLRLGQAGWATDEFRRLLERLDAAERAHLTIELDWLEALRDAASGGRVVAGMREAGLRIALDRIAIDALPLVRLDLLDADWLKVGLDRRGLAASAAPAALDALRRLDPARVILTEIDDERTLELGRQLGISHFQGPLIDRLARPVPPQP